MKYLDQNAPCRCCSTLRQHISDHFDPDGTLTGDEDPVTILREYNSLDPDGIGEEDYAYKLDVECFSWYLDELKEAALESNP